MKKFLTICMLMIFGIFSFMGTSFAVTAQPGKNPYGNPTGPIGGEGTDLPGSEFGQGEGFIQVVKNGINYLIGALALIALILLLWGGFQMVTAAGDDKKYDAGFTILKQAGFGLIMIGVAWFVVSIIFFVINLVTS